MDYTELQIKKSYINQGSENIIESLISPALRNAVSYKRSVGYFSSSVFKLLLSPLSSFIKNNGKILLIVSPNLSKEDISAIELGYKKKDALIHDRFIGDFESEIKMFDEETLNILYEMVARGVLDIKVASVKNNVGIYHDKLGILIDKKGNAIVFYGSANETISGYENNYEKVRVVRSWVGSEGDSVNDEIQEFDRLWENKNEFVDVYNFMDSVKKSILRVTDAKRLENSKADNPIKLYDYQESAINSWVSNGYKGFYVMATGTGKTWTAIYSAKKLSESKKCLIVIAAPYIHLVKQWEEDVKKAFVDSNIVMVFGNSSNWYADARHLVIGEKHNIDNQIILITTIKSFYSEKFQNVLRMSAQEKLLIIDEAHRFTRRPEWIKEEFSYLLGLSATPINGKNNLPGLELVDYFGGQVMNLPIEDALSRGFLVPYYYKPIFVDASALEEEKFNKISSNMAACYVNGVLVDKERFVKLVRARLRVIAMADEKITHIDSLLSKIEEKDHFIVYCGDGRLFDSDTEEIRHIQYVKRHLDRMGIKTSQFTASEDMVRRMELVDMFNKQEIDSLVAIRCLDEGINIPSIKSALILASNDDYREFVQRRGRILRRYKDKASATIYDVVVLPSVMTPKMAIIELRRYYEYAKLAINKTKLLADLDSLLKTYGIQKEEIMLYTELDTEVELDD